MEKYSLGLLLVLFVLGAVLQVSAYSDEDVLRFISRVPEEERQDFIRYAVIRGYEFTTRQPSGLEVPNTQIDANPKMFKAIYSYFLRYHSIPDVINFPHPLDIVCFPSGCIEIDDPGIHP